MYSNFFFYLQVLLIHIRNDMLLCIIVLFFFNYQHQFIPNNFYDNEIYFNNDWCSININIVYLPVSYHGVMVSKYCRRY